MKFTSIMKAEFMKYRRSVLWKGVFLIPLLSFLVLFADFYVRYDFLMSPVHLKDLSKTGIYGQTAVFIYESHLGTCWFLLLSLAIVAVSIVVNYIEYSENMWKQLLSRPVERRKIYISKWILVYSSAVLMVVLNGIGLIIISSVFKVQTDYFLIFKYVCFELCAVLGISSLQQFISCFIKNSLAAAAVGFCGSIGSYMFAQSQILSKVIPYSNILITVPFGDERDAYVGLAFSIASGILWLAVGIFEFNKRDIK